MIDEEYVSKCTDEQINMCVAWIKASKITLTPNSFELFQQLSDKPFYCGHDYNPTSNYNECIPLAIQCGMNIEFPNQDFGGMGTISAYDEYNKSICYDFDDNDNHMRLICEVYILLNI
jgi:ABC-type uncharacterized transport system substrate-binding protein